VAHQLGRLLNSGVLALFIGAGVSRVVRLPLWQELNVRIVREAPVVLRELFPSLSEQEREKDLPTADDAEAEGADVLKVLDRVEEVCSLCETLADEGAADRDRYVGVAPSWHSVVRRALYGEAQEYSFDCMFHPELVSLCSLLIGGKRGLVREVVTFNYDDLLESYLRLHGHPCHVVTPSPNRLTGNYGTIFYHPHGYVPLQDDRGRDVSFIVLSGRSYDLVASGGRDHLRLWRQLIMWMLCVRIGLFVGISGSDVIHKLYFDEALQMAGPAGTKRPLALAVLVGDAYLAPNEWLRRRVVPLEFADAAAVARFITQVCQEAAGLAGLGRT